MRAMSAPHVFVVHADLTTLACDAWLVPGGVGPGRAWRTGLPPKTSWRSMEARLEDRGLDTAQGNGLSGSERRAVVLADVGVDEPIPILTDISGTNRTEPAWYVEGARAFMREAVRVLRDLKRVPKHGRARYLLALPLLGTKGGGGAAWSGEITQLLLPLLQEEAAALDAPGEVGVDVVLALIEGPAWAAAQRTRQADPGAFRALPAPLIAAADALAGRARQGGLTIFLGAGVARPAGLPDWKRLLMLLAEERIAPSELAAFSRLSELDRAALIEQRLSPGETMGAATARIIVDHSRRVAMGHALLASLPVNEVVTTNYDDLFERASTVVGRPCARIPGGRVEPGQRFILKMHGCVSRPSTIVLTREDYLRFQENRTALAGIVQALLLTRHMLFVGFSFTDDNFHRIAHAVRNAIRGDGRRQSRFGTNLVLGGSDLVGDLWRDDLEWLAMGDHVPIGAQDDDVARAQVIAEQARLVEIFLDRLSAQAATVTGHLGDERWEGALSASERSLRDRLEALVAHTPADERETPAWREVRDLLKRLGVDESRFPPPSAERSRP